MKPKAVPWAMREQEGENIGMGIFPIIECVSTQDEPPVPTREAVEREMAALLGPPEPVSPDRFEFFPAGRALNLGANKFQVR